MQRCVASLLFLAAICSAAAAANNPISGIDPVLYLESGWLWGTFNEEVSTVSFTNDSIAFDIQPGDDDGQYPGFVNGGIGVNYGTDRFGSLDFDHEQYQVEMPFRILDDNEAPQFRIAVSDSDGTDGVRDEYYYYVNTFDYEIDEWETFVRPLTDYDAIWVNGGDGEMNFGNLTVQLMSMWNTVEPLNIEIGGIFITEINPTPQDAIFELNAQNFRQAWTWGSYNVDDAVVYTENTIIIDAESQGDAGGAQGGLGHGVLQTEFDGEDAELVVTAKVLVDNEADRFLIELRDNDELNGVRGQGVEEYDWEADHYMYEIFTDELDEDEFTELRIPLTDFSTSGQADGGVNLPGDGELNFGMYLMQIRSPWGPTERLNIEIESIRIESTVAGILGDHNNDGTLDVADLDLQAQVMISGVYNAEYDLNDDQVVDQSDRSIWVADLKNTWIGDADLDGEFNSSDFVSLFTAGEYEDGVALNSTWQTGDFNGDGEFDSADFVVAFSDGGYEQGPRQALNAVPEPNFALTLTVTLVLMASVSRGRAAPAKFSSNSKVVGKI